MSMSLDGLVSGLNTTEIIDALMDVHSIPRNLLKAKTDDKNVVIAQLQTLNASLQDLATRAGSAASGSTLARFGWTSSSTALSATVGTGAGAVTADVVIDRLATRHTVVTAAFTSWPDSPPVLTLQTANGERVEITAASDIARAVNDAGLGIRAAVVSVGSDASGQPLSRLQLTSDEPGAAQTFQVHRGTIADVEAGIATDVATETGAAVISQGADAQVRLWAGTAAEQVITSDSNTFTDLFPGIDVTVSAVSTTPVSLTVEPDDDARVETVAAFVEAIASLLTRIDNGSTATVPTDGSATTLGVFTGDSTVRALRQSLAQAVQLPVDGISPSSIGISVDRHGALSFDESAFRKALADDPDAVTALFTGVAARVEQTTTTYSDQRDGLLTARITGQQNEVKGLGEQMERWDVRLEQRRATLERTYARLETMLAQLQSQSSYLTSQLASLPTWESAS